jgi:Bax protein
MRVFLIITLLVIMTMMVSRNNTNYSFHKMTSNKEVFIAKMKPKIEEYNKTQPKDKQLPYKLVMAIAALETGWGTSRFAKEANNYFGEWTWTEEGVIPERRREGMTHKIRKFDDVEDSIRGFYRNINTHPAYKSLRKLRKNAEIVTAEALLPGLLHYSERKEEYLALLHTVIKSVPGE